MAKEWATAFYKSSAWNKVREYVIRRDRGLCQRCLSKGEFKPGLIVHHEVPLTPYNINDPSVSLNAEKLVYLCFDCHEEVHEELGVGAPFMKPKWKRELEKPRVGFDSEGNITRL